MRLGLSADVRISEKGSQIKFQTSGDITRVFETKGKYQTMVPRRSSPSDAFSAFYMNVSTEQLRFILISTQFKEHELDILLPASKKLLHTN